VQIQKGNVADPIIKKSLETLDENSEFVTCYVGDKPK
jgi:hypothetical protein